VTDLATKIWRAEETARTLHWHQTRRTGNDEGVVGAIIIAIVLVVALPVVVLMSSVLVAAGLGYVLMDEAERSHAGSELVELNT
jgi:hypothetical protein